MPCFTADLHTHPQLSGRWAARGLADFAYWADRKGIDIVGTGDFLTPSYYRAIQDQTEIDDSSGLLRVPGWRCLFVPTTEVELEFDHGTRLHRVHVLLSLPSLDFVNPLLSRLLPNLSFKEGRLPRLCMRPNEFLDRIWLECPEALVIPAHIWTPENSVLGSANRFSSLGECFGPLATELTAVETGLSGDPGVCWRVEDLDAQRIVSFSDAHTPQGCGREFTMFEGEICYAGLRGALTGHGDSRIVSTIEYFSELGPDYFNGHQLCGVIQSPIETRFEGRCCPVCHRELTIGSLQRAQELTTRPIEALDLGVERGWIQSRFLRRPAYRNLVPLREIILSSHRIRGKESAKTDRLYKEVMDRGCSEREILLEMAESDLRSYLDPLVAEGILRVRESRLRIIPGYDGSYGQLEVLDEQETYELMQLSLFEPH
ncbi:MAG: endonuclease Q family protein [Acidobacteriota bacterium]